MPGELVKDAELEGEVEEVTLSHGAGPDAPALPSHGLLVLFFRSSGKNVDFCVPVLFDARGTPCVAFEANVRRPPGGGH